MHQRVADETCLPGSNVVLILYDSGAYSSIYYESLVAFARAVYPWERILFAQDILDKNECEVEHWTSIRKQLTSLPGLENVKELFLCRMRGGPEKAILYSFPEAEVSLYEDGLATYFPQIPTCGFQLLLSKINHGYRIPGKLRREWSHYTSGIPECGDLVGICSRDWKRVKSIYLFLHPPLPLPRLFRDKKINPIKNDAVRCVIQTASNPERGAYIEQRHNSMPTVLILAQSFTSSGNLSDTEEFEGYLHACRKIIDTGYRLVFKEHPKASTGIGEKLEGVFNAGENFSLWLKSELPVEFSLNSNAIHAVAGASSSALFSIPKLFGIPAYTFVDLFPAMKSPDYVFLADTARRFLPPLHSLPQV